MTKESNMNITNEVSLVFPSRSKNESYARACVSAFAAQLDPTLEEVSDVKMAVSEAVTNCIVHAYPSSVGKIYINVSLLEGRQVKISVRDKGCGILNVKQAMEPLFTTLGGERAGLGFAVMESFTDKITVRSKPEKGTTVTMYKTVNGRAEL